MILGPLHRFMFGVVIFFPLTFFIWYISAAWHLAPVTLITERLVQWLAPEALLWLRLDGPTLVLASNFGHAANGSIVTSPVSDDILGFHLNPLIYSYSLPLLYALILATPKAERAWQLLWGTFLIFPTEVFSMTFSVLKTLMFEVGAAFQQQQAITPLQAELVAFAYQFGTLILPMIAPLIIWVGLNRSFMIELAPRLQTAFAR